MRNLSDMENPPFIFNTVNPSKTTIDVVEDRLELETLLKPLELSRGIRNVCILMDRLGSDATLEEVAGYYGISKERVRNIVIDGLNIIRTYGDSSHLRSGYKVRMGIGETVSEEALVSIMLIPQIRRVK